MNRIKKLIVGFLVSAMVLGMAITAYAAAGTITILLMKQMPMQVVFTSLQLSFQVFLHTHTVMMETV